MENIYLPEGQLIKSDIVNFYTRSTDGLYKAKNDGAILEGTAVLCDSEHNLYVDFGIFRGMMPRHEVLFGDIKDIAIITRVGKPICFIITDIIEEGGDLTILISRRIVQEACYTNYISNLLPGDIIPACITHLERFGAFCDIGCGVISLLPVDCISVSRLSNPGERFSPGQLIKAIVKDKNDDTGRVTLSHKELLGTWLENAALFEPGQTVTGVIRSIEEYGIFIELSPNLAGLAEWCDGVEVGQTVAVYIKNIIPDKMKIKLAIVDISPLSYEKKEILYFCESGHLDEWVYSPKGASKDIRTVF